jgi:DNA polymerase III subunit gamma/tau
MSYLVLARKYRPRNFAEMVGQAHVVQALGNALKTQRLHHAYLFTGTRGVGKTTVSRILAKSLNCVGPDGQGGITDEPCGVCQACTDIDSGRFVDYTELDAASNRGVDEIAQLLEQAVYKPVVGRFKVFMIDEVHMLTNTAFNAMLKTLEEPPEYLKFVLATTDPQKVPATVLSRCLQFNLRPMAPETVLEHLMTVLAQESVEAEPQALKLLARAARGSMRDALSLTDQAIAFGSGRLDEASVRTMLGSVDRSYVFRLIGALARGDGRAVVDTSEALRLNGLSAASTLEEMTTVLQRMAVLQAVPGMAGEGGEADPEIAEVEQLAAAMPADETQLLYSLCLHGRAELGLAPDEYAGLTMVLLRLLAFKAPAQAADGHASAKPSADEHTASSQPGSAAEPGKKSPQSDAVRAGAAAPQEMPATAPPNQKSMPNQAPAQALRAPAAIKSIAIRSAEPAGSREIAAPAQTENIAKGPNDANPVRRGSEKITPPKSALQASSQSPVQSPGLSDSADAPDGVDVELSQAWNDLVMRLVASEAVAALTRELALQSQLCSRDGGRWRLRVERESLNQTAAREKLQLALQTALDDPSLKVEVEIGAVHDTPARRQVAALAERQQAAEEAIRNDPFVQDMIRDWDAKIVPGSIKPVSSTPI